MFGLLLLLLLGHQSSLLVSVVHKHVVDLMMRTSDRSALGRDRHQAVASGVETCGSILRRPRVQIALKLELVSHSDLPLFDLVELFFEFHLKHVLQSAALAEAAVAAAAIAAKSRTFCSNLSQPLMPSWLSPLLLLLLLVSDELQLESSSFDIGTRRLV